MVLDGTVYLIYRDFERNEVGFIPVGLGEVPSRLFDSSDRPSRGLLWRNRLRLMLLHFALSLGGVVGRTSGSILNLNTLLGASEDVPHLSDFVFH